jgi:putative ABC transport system ATP-binding protein
MIVLEAQRVCKYYRQGTATEVRAVDEVSLAIRQGAFAVLSGSSGSGKTTLLALLGALDRPSRGEILFTGRSLCKLSDAELTRVRRRIGFIFQDFALLPRLPIWETVTSGLIPLGIGRQARHDRAKSLLTRVGLGAAAHARPEELSGGEQQRVAVARALAGEPEVVLADEPTSNLDPEAGRQLLALLQAIHAEGRTILIATHDPRLIAASEEVYHLEAGRLTAR